ncbi:MAG: DNA gyrase subunit A, partial [Bdellovibrio sp.]|nr:DNA gyrase subunit A [Bdellovibrio sp.]
MENTNEKGVTQVDISKEMRDAYLQYSMSVIVGRALPDVRDGLKPVHRRVLFAQSEMNNRHNRPYLKSARVVGDVIGKYHPHGDSAVYETMVRMAQDFSLRYPLEDGQGNFGSIDGDSAAAMRYTEVRMTNLAEELLNDLEKETVLFGPNYDDSLQIPTVLPAKFPNLLVNGSAGIAVGMATNIPPHNLGEVIDGCVHLINNPDCQLEDLMQHIKGPDFPTAGTIAGREGILQAYKKGRGIITLKAVAEIVQVKDREEIVVTEIPYQVNKTRLIERIAEIAKEKMVEGITDLRDESNRKGMRIVIELRKDINPHVMLNNLFKLTEMQSNFSINMIALVGNQPKTITLKESLYYYIQHQIEVIQRRTIYDLRKAEERKHILEGLVIALENIDAVIELIKQSKDGDT